MQDDDNNQPQQTPDDATAPTNDIFNPQTDEPKLPEDNDSPAAPATDVPSTPPVPEPGDGSAEDSDETYQGEATSNDDEVVGSDETPQPLDPQDPPAPSDQV